MQVGKWEKISFVAIALLFVSLVAAKVIIKEQHPQPKNDLAAFPLQQPEPTILNPDIYGYVLPSSSASLDSLKSNVSKLTGVIVWGTGLSNKKAFDIVRQNNKKARIFVMVTNPRMTVDEISTYASLNKVDGISLDIEDVQDQSKYAQFVSDLAVRLHAQNMLLSVNVPAQKADWKYKELGAAADQIILLDYDQHNWNSLSGPIAAADWFKASIEQLKRNVPSKKIIVGMGNYAYDWIEHSSVMQAGSVVAARSNALKEKAQIQADSSGNNYYRYQDVYGAWHVVWILDADSVKEEVAITKIQNAAGYALFRFGTEDRDSWKYLK